MSPPDFVFRRYLSKPFEKALHKLVEDERGQWWRDVLVHPNLKFAIRADAIDVYHRGASIFHITPDKEGRVVPRTHFKYLVRRQQGHVTIGQDGKTFLYGPDETTWKTYREGETLDEMIAACKRFAGNEKSGLHSLIMYHRVIDLEIAFFSKPDTETHAGKESDADELLDDSATLASKRRTKHQQNRLDAATLEDRDGVLWIVFHEAKHFKNKELRAKAPSPPKVSEQIAGYRLEIARFEPQIAESYRDVCYALQELHKMRVRAGPTPKEPLDPLVQRAANGERLHVDCEPRLIVFGFDDDQKKGAWKRDHQRLTDGNLTIYAVGKPDKKAAAAAFSRR